jgi:hypothetical protein
MTELTSFQDHKLHPLAAVDALDTNTALAELFSGTCKATTKWCSLCPSLAQYQCCTTSDGSFCGLLLCERDMVLLTGVHDGDRQKMLREDDDEASAERSLGLRADRDFLKQDGLLMRYVLWSSGQSSK